MQIQPQLQKSLSASITAEVQQLRSSTTATQQGNMYQNIEVRMRLCMVCCGMPLIHDQILITNCSWD